MDEFDKFYGKAFVIGDSLAVTIPANLVKGIGLKPGDRLKVMIRKEVENE